MAFSSTVKTNCYNFLNSNLRTIIDNKFERNASTSSSVSFDEFAETRTRTTRAASLALPHNSLLDLFDKEQSLNPVNLKPTTLTSSIKHTISSTVNRLRRHSTSAGGEQDEDAVDCHGNPNSAGVFFTNPDHPDSGVLPLSNENLKRHQRMSMRGRSMKSSVSSTGTNSPAPAVPQRTYLSKGSTSTTQSRQMSTCAQDQGREHAPVGDTEKYHNSTQDDDLEGVALSEPENDDQMSIESSVFEDTPPFTVPLMGRQQRSCDFGAEENSSAILTKKMLSSSNRSSSDSNKSQITIDTGYMSSTTSTNSGITNNTESTTERITPGSSTAQHGSNSAGGIGTSSTGNHNFRSRFSSEDTQSSLDSFISSSEPQTHQRFFPDYSSSSSFGTANPSPSYLQTGGTSSYYLASGSNDVIEYLQKYSARNYPNNLRTPPASANSHNPANIRQKCPSQQQVHKSSSQQHQQQQHQQISGCSSVNTVIPSSGGGVSSVANNSQLRSAAGVGTTMSGTMMSRETGTGGVGPATTSSAGSGGCGVSGGSEPGSSNLPSTANSMTSLSHATSAHNNKHHPSTSLAKLTPPPPRPSSPALNPTTHSTSSATPATSTASQSVSLSGTGVTTITATTTVTTTTQPRNSSSGGSAAASSRSSAFASIALPLRTQVSFDSAKIIQTGQILGAKITQHFTGSRQSSQDRDKDKQVVGGHPQTQQQGKVPCVTNPPRRGLNGILNKPPPLTQIHHTKMNQRQDSNISSDSFSITSSPGYNSKSMEAPLLQHTAKIHRTNRPPMKHQDSSDSFNMTMRGPTSAGPCSGNRKFNLRQDSTISSDSFSQTSSPGYNSKLMEAPLLAHAAKMHKIKHGFNERLPRSPLSTEHHPTSPIIKSASTPASLQTIVRFQDGSNMSLQHKIVQKRKDSNPYITRGRLKFRLCQILINAVALLAIAGGLAAYFNAYPTVKYLNKTYVLPASPAATLLPLPPPLSEPNTVQPLSTGIVNPAPGVCLPVIVKFCQQHNVPYNFTVYPNYIGNFGQIEAQADLENYEALVDVRCYELVGLFLCSLFVPRCGISGISVPPCRSLCYETMRRCGFFFDVFNLDLPDYLKCNLFTESADPDECVGHYEVIEAKRREKNPTCTGFLCDQRRCIPGDWRCDGHVDCLDQTDEFQCDKCGNGTIYCGGEKCMSQKHVCDGVVDCPFGQDERNCIRLSERNGDQGKGILEVYKADIKQWAPACVKDWDGTTSPSAVCSMLGYSAVNGSWIKVPNPNFTNQSMMVPPQEKDTTSMWQMLQKKKPNLMKQFLSCPVSSGYHSVAELSCSNFECGKVRRRKDAYKPRARIVGGAEAKPGDWPFIAAILGGPEEIFYCAGVLISDQWVLTASHCVGNTTHRNLNDWTVQLGITRRHSHTYYGKKVKVSRVIPHPHYSYTASHDNDIALIQLATRVAFHEHLLPICLPPSQKEIRPGTVCTVIGWGKREDKNVNPDAVNLTYEPAINEVRVPILPRDVCNEWIDTANVTEGMICAGYPDGGKDACQGDSGGPLLCQDPNDSRDRWYVGGIVSWGVMCAHPKLPGVYANVPKYVPWIYQQINKYSTPLSGM